MLSYQKLFTKDFKFGNLKENEMLPFLQSQLGLPLNKTNCLNIFDYVNDEKKILIELKCRRNTKNKYPSTMVGLNKVVEGFRRIDLGYTVYFVFKFTDCVCKYKLDKETYKNEWVCSGGRCDRGRYEIKKYVFIPIENLENF